MALSVTVYTHFYFIRTTFFGATVGVLKFLIGFTVVKNSFVLSDFGVTVRVFLIFFFKKQKKNNIFNFLVPRLKCANFRNYSKNSLACIVFNYWPSEANITGKAHSLFLYIVCFFKLVFLLFNKGILI